jgi:hypothetical protein
MTGGENRMLPTPDWLTLHGGELRLAKDHLTASVYFSGRLQYVVAPVPAKGKHTCRVTETVNGTRMDGGVVYDSREAAFQGGLEELRAKLGW